MTNPLQCRLRQWNLAACLVATSYRPLETKVNVKWVLSIVDNRTCLISCQFIDVTEFVRVACLLFSLLESTGRFIDCSDSKQFWNGSSQLQVWFVVVFLLIHRILPGFPSQLFPNAQVIRASCRASKAKPENKQFSHHKS